jgi:hypothetical protein
MYRLPQQQRFAFPCEDLFCELPPEPDRKLGRTRAGHDFLVLNLRPDLIERTDPIDSPYSIDVP